jgi:hypothetical protein
VSPALIVIVAAALTADPASPPAVSATAAAPSPTVAAPSASPSTITGVEIAIAAAPPAAATAVREDLEDLLARRGITARYRRLAAVDREEVLRPSSESPCTLACIWIDLGVATAGRALVYISARASEQVVVRSLPLPSGVDEVAREEVSHIVASSVEALQAGLPLPVVAERADSAIAKTTRSPPPPAPVTPVAHGPWASAGLGAGAAHEGGSTFALPTASLSLLVGPSHRRGSPALWLSAGAFSSDASGDDVTLRFRGGELAVLAAAGIAVGGRAVARLGVGPGLELRQATPAVANGASPSGVQLDDPRVDPTFFVRAAARLEVRLFERVALFASVACDARVVSHRYTVDHDGVTQAMFEPDVLRPSLLLGVDARLTGEGRP